jgi:uncharacterized RDD family membrane protein YckC
MACWVYEGILMFGVVFLAGYLFSTLNQIRNALDDRWALMAFLFWVIGIYFTWFWSRGQTLAMKTWHIRLVDTQGQRVSQLRAFYRYLLSWIWFLPPLALLSQLHFTPAEAGLLVMAWVLAWAWMGRWRSDRQFWHDVWAGTRLVSTLDPTDSSS